MMDKLYGKKVIAYLYTAAAAAAAHI